VRQKHDFKLTAVLTSTPAWTVGHEN